MSHPLIIFTRFPEVGKTKTRMIPLLGAEGAAQLQREMTEHTVRQARKTDARIEVRYTGGTMEKMRDWLGTDLNYAEQGEGDLGHRMERAFEAHFSDGTQKAVIIGADCPSNDWRNIQNAFELLEQHDCVIGPANDGGYYLIGLNGRASCPRAPAAEGRTAGTAAPTPLFQNIDWGGKGVFQQTMNAASGLKVELLKLLHDVDVPEDLPPRISVIIPTLNEEDYLPDTLERVQEGFNIEAVVVDCGSTDGTPSIVPDGLTCLDGRAGQQNLGAKSATGELLLFLHADTLLPDGWDWIVRETLSDATVALGAFTFRVRESFPGRTFIEKTANWRSKSGSMPFGDQGLFLRKETFEQAGGFPELPIMEDYAFVRLMQRLGKVVTVPEAAITSGRRWADHGVFKVTLVNKLMILGYHLGIPPHRLASFYRGRTHGSA